MGGLAAGEEEKTAAATWFCYPKQKTAREWTSGGESNKQPGNTGRDVKTNRMPSVQSHLQLWSRVIIEKTQRKEIKWKLDSDVVVNVSQSVDSRPSDHGPVGFISVLWKASSQNPSH